GGLGSCESARGRSRAGSYLGRLPVVALSHESAEFAGRQDDAHCERDDAARGHSDELHGGVLSVVLTRNLCTRVKNESGAILLITAAAMGALILLVGFVLDTGNWFQHKRHLQLQVDAAAFAGADSIALPASACSSGLIGTSAHNYGGADATHPSVSNNPPDPLNPSKPYNNQIGGTPPSRIHILVNPPGYFGDINALENLTGTNAPCRTGNEFCPCTFGVDIKGTESDLPWFFGGNLVPRINAHARVCLMQESTSGNSLPIAVPNPKPKSAAAILIDYSTNAVIGTPIRLNECTKPAPPAPPNCPSGFSQLVSLGTQH